MTERERGAGQPLTALSRTALGAALVRAAESLEPDRLFDDPFAEAFLAAAPDAFADEPDHADDPAASEAVFNWFGFHVAIRTRFFDDFLLAGGASGCRQVVLLAAGLDTRAFRLAWPAGVRLFEIDLPEVLAFKEGVLTGHAAVPRCERIAVPADLREDWPARLVEAGFAAGKASAWLAEGLLVYLSAEEAVGLLTAVGELSAVDSRLSIEHGDILDDSLIAASAAMPAMAQFRALWKGGLGGGAPDWLARHGWAVRTHDRSALAASYGRPVPGHVAGGFITADRTDR